jgi:dihydroflavonol-4-reductase
MLTAVTGASGMLGNTLVRQLLARGDRVRALETGSGTPRSLAGLDVELVRGSVLDASVLGRLVRGVDRVFHLAAKIDLDRDRDGTMHAVNVEGTRKVAAACLDARVRLVHCSSHAALVKDPLSEPLSESKPLALADPCDYHRSKAQAEKLVLDLVRTQGLDAVVVSPGTVTGPNDFKPSIMGRALIDLYHRRIPVLMEVLSDYVDSRDVVSGMIAAAERGRTGERYLLTGHVLTLREMVGHWGDLTAALGGLGDAADHDRHRAAEPASAAVHRRGAARQRFQRCRVARKGPAGARLLAARGQGLPCRRPRVLPAGRPAQGLKSRRLAQGDPID